MTTKMNSNARYTQGEWKVHNHAPFSVWCGDTQISSGRWIDEESHDVAEVCEQHQDRAEANARLIAAAPDLFDALKAIVAYEAQPDFSQWAKCMAAAEAAISKAGA